MFTVAVLGLLAFIAYTVHQTRRSIVALGAEVVAFIARITPQIDAAVADIQKIHNILDASGDPDIEAARAAVADAEARFATLKAEVDRPEPGEEPPPPPVEG
jgi:multidrug resistance efflux pump